VCVHTHEIQTIGVSGVKRANLRKGPASLSDIFIQHSTKPVSRLQNLFLEREIANAVHKNVAYSSR